jgi:hypothetical protein
MMETSEADKKLDALLRDIRELAAYMHERGEKTYALSARFAENAKKNLSNREFDLNQSRMLDYQHTLWHEMGNLVEKLIKKYEE